MMHSIAKELDIAIIAVHDLNKASITGAIQGQLDHIKAHYV